MIVGLDLRAFLVVDLVCDLDEGVVGSDIGFIVGYLGPGISCLGLLGSSLEDFVVIQFLLQNF